MPFTATQLAVIETAIVLYENDPAQTSPTKRADLVTANATTRRTLLLPYVQQLQTAYQQVQTNLSTAQTAQTASVNQQVTDAAAVVTGL